MRLKQVRLHRVGGFRVLGLGLRVQGLGSLVGYYGFPKRTYHILLLYFGGCSNLLHTWVYGHHSSHPQGLGFGVWGLGFGGCLVLRLWGLGLTVGGQETGMGLGVWGLGARFGVAILKLPFLNSHGTPNWTLLKDRVGYRGP